MFGENIMLGQTIVKLDKGNRITLPKFTNAEVGDELLIVDEIDFLSVYSKETYIKQIKCLEDKLKKCENVDELRKNNLKLLRFYRTILSNVKCDKYHRIYLGSVKNNTNDILCIGAKDHLIIQAKKGKN